MGLFDRLSKHFHRLGGVPSQGAGGMPQPNRRLADQPNAAVCEAIRVPQLHPEAKWPQQDFALVPGGSVGLQLAPRNRPLLVWHWASWDDLSLACIPALRTLTQEGQVDLIAVAWDEFVAPPMPRISGMATRDSRWSEGVNVRAVARQWALDWPHLVVTGEPEAFFGSLGLEQQSVPQLHAYDATGRGLGGVLGPLHGQAWTSFVQQVQDGRPDITG